MAWRRLGNVFPGPERLPWAVSHAALPVAHRNASGSLDVFFSARDDRSRSRIGRLELTVHSWKVGGVSQAPCLDLGSLGTFDDAGVTSSWTVTHDGRRYHYYTGWTVGTSVPFYFYVGLAVIDERAGVMTRVSPAPILDRSAIDPYLTASPCVLIEDGVWRMWYVSAIRWEIADGKPKHYYHIKYAESFDGVLWRRTGHVCIDFASPDEHAIARPCVMRDGNRYCMWYCYRGTAYKIGYAESPDGLRWERRDGAGGLVPSSSGWDSEMVAYPYVFESAGVRYMLYNGNGYGRTGFGAAVWEPA